MKQSQNQNMSNIAAASNSGEPAININVTNLSRPKEIKTILDYSALDELLDFLAQEPEELLPILCGYFNKVVTSLLSKIKQKMLIYLLVERKGFVFDMLMRHLEHHSLAQLMIELMQLKIVPANQVVRDRFSSDFDKEDKTEDGEQSEEEKNRETLDKMTPQERLMHDTLTEKKQMVVRTLLERLSSKNRDFELCLNAYTVLHDMADMETTFGKLVERENMQLLIKAATDTRNVNQGYALNILTTLIKEFPDYERHIGVHLAQEF